MDNTPYDAWLHWFVTMRCNLDCGYCFENPIRKTAALKPIRIQQVINSLEQSQKVFKISLTGGGEPFLIPNINEFCLELTQKHYLSINTNLTSPKIKEFAGLIHPGGMNPERIIIMHASLHIEELLRKKLVHRFLENYQLLKERGVNLEVKAVAYPSLVPQVNEYRKYFHEQGINFEFEPFVGNYREQLYPESYTADELQIFALQVENNHMFFQKNRPCNAGFNVGIVMPSGETYSCFRVSQRLGNINRAIQFRERLIKCPDKTCGCPLNFYDQSLFQRALAQSKIKIKKTNPLVNYLGLIKLDRDFIKKEY